MSENGGYLDVVYDDFLSRRALTLRPHPKQMVLAGISSTPTGNDVFPVEFAPMLQDHECTCWKCHPELIPAKEEGTGTISIRREGQLEPRFWKTTLDGQSCGFVKEAKPGRNGYVWLSRTPPHACKCGSHYSCTTVLYGNVTVTPDGDDY